MVSKTYSLAWRLFRHEAKRGELTIILMAIVLSVASVLSLSLFSERLQSALTERSAAFMAADRNLNTRNVDIDPTWLPYAESLGIRTAAKAYARSMAFANDNMVVVDLGAANEPYPLKGELKIADAPFGASRVVSTGPAPGEVWVESRLFQLLDLELGQTLELGDANFVITQVLSEVPDSGFSIFASNPKVLINLRDLPSTNIAGPGSRVGYTYFLAGDSDTLDDYYQWLEPQLDDEIHEWESVEDDSSAVGNSIRRAEQYFLLASLLAIVLAAVSIAVAAQRYSQRHYDPVAIMKTLGASRRMVQQIYLLQITFITLLGIVIGVAVGFVLQQLVVLALAERVDVSMEVWHWRPLVISVFTGGVCAMLFSLYPLLKLFSVPPLRVLRRDIGANMRSRLVQFMAAGGAVLLLMYAYSQNIKISLILFVSGVVLVIALLFVTIGLIRLGRRLGQGSMGPWTLAWARIKRRAMDNSVQLISFSVTIMLLLVVLVMRNDMISQWRDQLPQGTPNYFISNVTEAQRPVLETQFADYGVDADVFYPVVRARFVAVNEDIIRTDVTKEAEADQDERRRGLGREANLTWSRVLQNENRIIEGAWLDDWQPGQPYGVSVEEGVARRMDLKMGDELTFNIGSEVITVVITSIRQVNWQTMQPNFFFVLQPEVMAAFSPTYITSFHLPGDRKSEITEILQPFSSVTLFDVDAQIDQLRGIVDQVSMAVEFILILVLCAGSLVLIAQVQASMDERQQELAILRTLGAKGALIRQSVIFEFLIIGSVAGFMAALANEFSLYLLQTQVFQMTGSVHLTYWLIAPAVGAVVVGVLGAAGCWRLLALNTSHLLRKMV